MVRTFVCTYPFRFIKSVKDTFTPKMQNINLKLDKTARKTKTHENKLYKMN